MSPPPLTTVLANFLVRHAMLFGFLREGCQQARGVLFALLHLGAGESRSIHECVAKECTGNFDFDGSGEGGDPAIHKFRERGGPPACVNTRCFGIPKRTSLIF